MIEPENAGNAASAVVNSEAEKFAGLEVPGGDCAHCFGPRERGGSGGAREEGGVGWEGSEGVEVGG